MIRHLTRAALLFTLLGTASSAHANWRNAFNVRVANPSTDAFNVRVAKPAAQQAKWSWRDLFNYRVAKSSAQQPKWSWHDLFNVRVVKPSTDAFNVRVAKPSAQLAVRRGAGIRALGAGFLDTYTNEGGRDD